MGRQCRGYDNTRRQRTDAKPFVEAVGEQAGSQRDEEGVSSANVTRDRTRRHTPLWIARVSSSGSTAASAAAAMSLQGDWPVA